MVNLPFGRLYWRIALYISAALAAFVLLGIVSVVLVASIQLENYITIRQGPLGQEAATVLSAEGEAGLQRWLRSTAVPRDVTVFVLDSGSRDILEREIPSEYEEFVRASVVGPPESAVGNYRPVRLAPQLIGPDGAVYAFLVLPSAIKLWGSAATVLGLVLVALLVIGSVAGLIARTVGRPVGELQAAVRELARGRIEARAPAALAARRDEIGALAADFNSMAKQFEVLLAERQQLMAELSHELRSPLARLQAAIALAGQRPGASPAELERMEREIRRMNRVIGDLLRFSRLGAAASIARRLIRLEHLIRELGRDEQIEASARQCELRITTAGALPVVGDPDLLRSGLENILRNAIRYTRTGAAVDVEARQAGDRITVTIADHGPGVPKDLLDRIFEPYFRVTGMAGDSEGTGLGLAIARRVFEAHGGSVRAELREGGGLTMTVQLPVAVLN
ncbi:MAG: ATP-binding protein [Gammaproteobacteria bacterium]|nr:ATP-binding protein [Gammaproteobacteria bacterium]